MGVYISMEMPEKTYAHCMLIKDLDGSVQLHVCTKNSEEISEWEYFDLVPVPPHGDLIDRDPFIEFIKTHWDSYDQWFVEQLEARPTIIPASEEVYDKYTDTAGNLHFTGTQSGEHIIRQQEGE